MAYPLENVEESQKLVRVTLISFTSELRCIMSQIMLRMTWNKQSSQKEITSVSSPMRFETLKSEGHIVEFAEKPKGEELKAMCGCGWDLVDGSFFWRKEVSWSHSINPRKLKWEHTTSTFCLLLFTVSSENEPS
ncbi:hypothetical protein SUGI_0628280 [Cryptomeria japonica]|nr:hypothetical protein SUGI_0628280 [Cryptomeria japonica]